MPRDGNGITSADVKWGTPDEGHTFTRLGEQHYQLEIPEYSALFDVDRLWRDRHELCGEMAVTCGLKGARGFDGNVYSGHVNFSSAYRRRDVCARLRARANTAESVDWDGLLDELAARVVRAERDGKPARPLSDYDRPGPAEVFSLDGLVLPRRHPSILFGDGGVFKSYLGLYIAGWLGQQGVKVLFADWELEGEDHRDRLERLFGPAMPEVFYLRLHRPMIEEIDGLRREITAKGIEYVICDSVGYATAGAPESAEAAMAYFRAVRAFGVGSVHLAHVVKAGDDKPDPARPFGSTFWHNSARSTWLVKRADSAVDGRIAVALYNKKSNLGPLRPAVGFEIDFGQDRTWLHRVDVADIDELATSLPVWQRMKRALASGPMTLAALADEFGARDDAARTKLIETMDREVRRKKIGKTLLFTKLTNTPDGVHKIALLSDRSEVA